LWGRSAEAIRNLLLGFSRKRSATQEKDKRIGILYVNKVVVMMGLKQELRCGVEFELL
jgi:hypothetical protein